MTFAVFTRSDMVINPGWPQIAATALVLISTCGITFAMFGRYSKNHGADILSRVLLACVAFVVMFFPDKEVGAQFIIVAFGQSGLFGVALNPSAIPVGAAAIVVAALIYGIARHRQIAPPETFALPEGAIETGGGSGDLGVLAAEARRDYG
jgi:hypothetical protein